MKKTLNIIIVILLFTSCSKYEDGPKISLRSPENRLSTTIWHSQTLIYKNEESEIQDLYLVEFWIDKDYGEFKIQVNNSVIDGTCEFAEDKTRIIFLTINDTTELDTIPETIISSWKIKKLKNKKLWIETNFQNNDLEIHFTK